MRSTSIKIAINAQLDPQRGTEGINSVVKSLVWALGRLSDGNEEYTIVTSPEAPDWIEPYLGRNQTIKVYDFDGLSYRDKLVSAVRNRCFSALIKRILKPGCRRFDYSLGFWEALKCDVIHFPYQFYKISGVPFVFNPHDLQHRHLPDFFSEKDRDFRDKYYRKGCMSAAAVAVASSWIKEDLSRQFYVDSRKIQVIPWGAPTSIAEDIIGREGDLDLPDEYIFYPATTWPHKNHSVIIEALHDLKKQGINLNVVFTGRKTGHWEALKDMMREYDIADKVVFYEMVSDAQLRYIYENCLFVVIPTAFEAASFPMYEAWSFNKAVICSDVTSLPKQASGAALVIKSGDHSAFADSIKVFYSDENLRREYEIKGALRLKEFTWEKAARAYRALYRKSAGAVLSSEDRIILDESAAQL